jgi:hypothetical protein
MARGPVTPPLLGAFFVFAAVISAATAVTLLAPGTPLDGMWRIKPAEYAQLRGMGAWVGAGFVVLCAAAAIGSIGILRRRRWGWWFAVVGIGINALADAARIPMGAVFEGLIGVTVAGAILLWLTRPPVRALFDRPAA